MVSSNPFPANLTIGFTLMWTDAGVFLRADGPRRRQRRFHRRPVFRVALRGNGAQIDIYERIAGPIETRGAGIVIQPELTNLLEQYGAPALPHTSCSSRQYLSSDAGDGHLQPMPQQFTSWEAIYKTLRTAFPDAHYHTGASILSFETTANGIDIELSGKARRRVDLVVCADGAQSETRRRLLPEVMPHYAGYIAWRGSLAESDVPDHLGSFFDDKFSFCDARSGGHVLVYLIPGANADTTAGKRLLNWVWYVHASEAELPELLTDKDGRRHHSSLPQGGATEAAVAALRDHARCEIHPRLAELVASTPGPFIQTIVDVAVPRTVFRRGLPPRGRGFRRPPAHGGSYRKSGERFNVSRGSSRPSARKRPAGAPGLRVGANTLRHPNAPLRCRS